MTLAALVLGAILSAVLLLPMWFDERRRLYARNAELYRLLEAKAAPAEYAGYVAEVDPYYDNGVYLSSEDGLVVFRVDDEDDD